MSEIRQRLSKFTGMFSKGGGLKLVVILGIAGMALILLSSLSDGSSDSKNSSDGRSYADSSFDEYSRTAEEKLEETLSEIEGVGRVKVMLSFGGTEEYIYAQDGKTKQNGDDVSKESEYVLIGSGNGKQALLQRVKSPEITGAAIVCEGGDSNVVKERIYNTVSAVLGISSEKIYVTKLG